MPSSRSATLNVSDYFWYEGGPAGCVVASRLANNTKASNVLLLEAGGDNFGESTRYLSDRFQTLMQPGMNWGYQTAPQFHFNNRQLDYSRGKCLGGSSALNFAGWTIGPKQDYNEWARLVEDDSFDWEHSRRRLDSIAHVNLSVDVKYQKYYQPVANDHANNGQLSIECPAVWERGLVGAMNAADDFGLPINKDINSGDPTGLGLFPATSKNGIRMTAADAFISDPPANLTVQTHCPVHKVISEGNRAIGVRTEGDRQCNFLSSNHSSLDLTARRYCNQRDHSLQWSY